MTNDTTGKVTINGFILRNKTGFQQFTQLALWVFLLFLEYSSASYKYNFSLLSFFILLVFLFFFSVSFPSGPLQKVIG